MTVTTSSYTTNSKKIVISNEVTSDNIITAVDSAIVSLGWTQYDTIFNSVPGYGVRGTGCIVTTTGSGTLTGVTVTTAGSGYSLGDILQIVDGSHLNGGSNTALFSVTALSGSGVSTVSLISGGSGYTPTSGVSTICAGSIYSPMETFVYRAINSDGITYKYLILRWNPLKQEFYTSTCESWNTTTKVPTNECWINQGNFVQGYDLKDSFIWIGATSKHIVFWNFIKNEPGLWTMIFEFERVSPEDLASNTIPCFAWTNSLMFGTAYAKANNTTTSTMMICPPRTLDNQTGAFAVTTYAPSNSRGLWPPQFPSATLAITVDANLLHLASAYNISYGWDVSKQYVSPITISHQTKGGAFGRIFNLGVTGNFGSALDTTTLKLDSTGGWPSGSGSSSAAVFLPMNGGAESDAGYSATKSAAVYGQGNAVIFSKPLAIGDYVWIACSDGVRRWSMSSGQGGGTTLVRSEANGVQDIVFDGKQTVYASTSAGVVAIDTENTATQTLVTTTNGASYLSIDEKYVYASSRTASTAPNCYVLSRSSFSLSYTYTLATSLLTVASGFGTPVPDYQGNIYLRSTTGTTAGTTPRVVKTRYDGTSLFNNADPYFSSSQNWSNGGSAIYIEHVSGKIWYITSWSNTIRFWSVNTDGTYNSYYDLGNTYTNGANQLSPSVTADYRGDLYTYIFRGHLQVGNKRPGLAMSSPGFNNKISFLPTSTPSGVPVSLLGSNQSSFSTTPSGASGWTTTNSVRLFSSMLVTAGSDNRIYYVNKNYNLTNLSGTTAGRLVVKG